MRVKRIVGFIGVMGFLTSSSVAWDPPTGADAARAATLRQKDPKTAEEWFELAKLDGSMEHAEKALALNPRIWDAYFFIADRKRNLIGHVEIDVAEIPALYEKALTLGPEDPARFQLALASFYHVEGHQLPGDKEVYHKKAAELFRRIPKEYPQSPAAPIALMRLWSLPRTVQDGRLVPLYVSQEDRIEALQTLIKKYPNDKSFPEAIEILASEEKDPKKQLELYDRLLTERKDVGVRAVSKAAESAVAAGDIPKAARYYEQAIERQKTLGIKQESILLRGLGLCYHWLGKKEQAEKYINLADQSEEESIRRNPAVKNYLHSDRDYNWQRFKHIHKRLLEKYQQSKAP